MQKKSLLSVFGLENRDPFLFAVVVVAIAATIRFFLDRVFHGVVPFVILTAAVTLSALYGGLGPGLLATALSIASAWLLFDPANIVAPSLASDTADMESGLLLLTVVGTLLSVLGELIRREKKQSESLLQELQSRNKELQQSELTNRALLEASAQGVIAVDGDGKIKIANDYTHQMFGYSSQELIGKYIDILMEDVLQHQYRLHRREFFSKPKAKILSDIPLNGRRKDGSVFPVQTSIGISETPFGPIGVSFISDITDKKSIEAALIRQQSELQNLVNYSPVLISMQDLEGRLLLANRSYIATFSPSDSNLAGQMLKDTMPDYVASKSIEADRTVLSTRLPVEFEFDMPDHTGSWRNFKTIKFPLDYLDTKETFGIGGFATDITELRDAERQLLMAAKHDLLTGLPNRVLIYDMGAKLISSARDSKSKMALLFFDLDRFKPINDTYGRDVGDQLLKEVSKRLIETSREGDVVGRLSGDEFIALISNIRSRDIIESAALMFISRLREPYLLEGLEIRMSPSIGISQYPEDGHDIDKLIQCADAAMRHAKNAGRNQYEFFSAAIVKNGARIFILEQEMRSALEEDLFQLAYQPIVEAHTGDLTAVEALIRWPRLNGDVRMPSEFISAAESSGLIIMMGNWIIKRACKEFEERIALGMPPVKVAINISAYQFRSPNFVDNLLGLIEASTMGHEWLELEVTESTVMSRIDEAAKILSTLKDKGFSVSLDDFGTGYSSLSMLAQLPIDKLKIDRSFVTQIETEARSMAITETVIALGHKLGMSVVAEGIETISVFSRLQTMGCNHFQGYLFSRPLPSNDLVIWEKTRSRKIIPLHLPQSSLLSV
jgi:diguanylate cyclase (GGDEF)-like protein/PAS domain S-box-containing protein